MSNSGVNAGFAKCFILFMALVILLQGCLYFALSIWSLTLRRCSKGPNDISANPFEFAMNLIYAIDEKCGNPSVTVAGAPAATTLTVDWTKSFEITNRTYILLMIYVVISALWVVTSLVVISRLCCPVTKWVKACCFWPWFVVVMAGSILDAVATGYHVHDIVHTTSADKTLDYVGVAASEEVMAALKNFDAYFVTPAVLMTCVCSRVILIWLLNIFGSSFCLSLSQALYKKNLNKKYSVNSSTASAAPAAETQTDTQPLQQVSGHLPPPAAVPPQIRPKPLPIQNANSVQHQQQRQADSASEAITYRNTDIHPNRLDYPQQTDFVAAPQQQLSLTSPLNTRYSNMDSLHLPNSNQRVSVELRSQLPWSYINMQPPTPRKPQTHVYPDIPTPDYTHP